MRVKFTLQAGVISKLRTEKGEMIMIIKLLMAPVIGTIIGYCTNLLAVKMLFHPRTEKHIGSFRVPFTPGVIYKGKKRLAAAASEITREKLVTEEAIEERLLDQETVYMIRAAARERIELVKSNQTLLVKDLLQSAAAAAGDASRLDLQEKAAEDEASEAAENQEEGISRNLKALSSLTVYDENESSLRQMISDLRNVFSDRIYSRVCSAGLGDIAAETINEKFSQVLAGSFLGQMMGGSVTQTILPLVSQTVDEFIQQRGKNLIDEMLREETDRILNMKASDAAALLGNCAEKYDDYIVGLYTEFVRKFSGRILEIFDIGSIVGKAVEDMNNEELEKLVMSAMKNELGAIVNLGALIGLVLGLINMLIYLI